MVVTILRKLFLRKRWRRGGGGGGGREGKEG
jgi:hypothetical protein